jgi:hypothetical protein
MTADSVVVNFDVPKQLSAHCRSSCPGHSCWRSVRGGGSDLGAAATESAAIPVKKVITSSAAVGRLARMPQHDVGWGVQATVFEKRASRPLT